MSSGVARGRLSEERRAWRKNHPHGFVAKPETAPDGSVNLMVWHCTIPGKAGTDWEGGNYPLTLYFTEDYPSKAPKCMFPKDFFHLNVYGSGMVCLSILNEDGWRPSITVRQILVGVQDLLHQPNPASPANYDEYELFVKDPAEYQRRVRQQAKHLLFEFVEVLRFFDRLIHRLPSLRTMVILCCKRPHKDLTNCGLRPKL